jgi:hypothetical protein
MLSTILLMLVFGTGCATVKPWQRGTLAGSIMQADRDPIGQGLLDHVYFSREARLGRSRGGRRGMWMQLSSDLLGAFHAYDGLDPPTRQIRWAKSALRLEMLIQRRKLFGRRIPVMNLNL